MAVDIKAVACFDLGLLESATLTVSFDAAGGEMLVVAVSGRPGGDGSAPLTLTYDGIAMAAQDEPRPNSDDNGHVQFFFLPRPAAGSNDLAVTAPWWFGYAQLAVFSIAGLRGPCTLRAGQFSAATAMEEQTLALAGCLQGSALLGVVGTYFGGNSEIAASGGWTVDDTAAGTSMRISAVTAVASSSGTLSLGVTSPTYENMLLAVVGFAPLPAPLKTIVVENADTWVTGGIDSSGNIPQEMLTYDFMTLDGGGSPQLPPLALVAPFHRASTAQYRGPDGAWHTAAVDEPRWMWDEAGNLLGIMNEAADPETGRAEEILQASITSSRLQEYGFYSDRDSGALLTTSYLADGDLPYIFQFPHSPNPMRMYQLGPEGGPKAGVGIGGVIEAQLPFDCQGGDLLILALLYASARPAPEMTYGGRKAVPVPGIEDELYGEDDGVDKLVGRMSLYALANPPSGENTIRIWSYDRFVGQLIVHAVAVSGASGQVGVRMALHPDWPPVMTFPFANTRFGSKLLMMDASLWTRPASLTVAAPWEELAHDPGDDLDDEGNPIQFGKSWLWAADGGGDVAIEITRGVLYGNMQLIGLELHAALQDAPAQTGAVAWAVPPLDPGETTGEVFTPQPEGQKFATYWESWSDYPWVSGIRNVPTARNAYDYALSRVPAYVDHLSLHATAPMSLYENLDSDMRTTTGLNFPGTARQLKEVLDVLRDRCPDMKIVTTIFQIVAGDTSLNPAETVMSPNREPYQSYGWGGMTQEHWDRHKRLIDDLGLDGVELDYELSSQNPSWDHHGWTEADGTRRHYNDTEQLAIVRAARATFPRNQGYILGQSFWSVGCFGEGPTVNFQPGGWNAGVHLCLEKHEDTRDAHDFIHLMNYDAGSKYKPIDGLKSVQLHFPNTPVRIGIRVGTPEWGPTPAEQPRRNLYDFRRYLNASILSGADGCTLYAMFWDLVEPSAAQFSPSGRYGPDYPDANMAAALIAEVYRKPSRDLPLVGLRRQRPAAALALAPPAGVIAMPPSAQVNWRITEAGDRRVTEDTQRRQVEG